MSWSLLAVYDNITVLSWQHKSLAFLYIMSRRVINLTITCLGSKICIYFIFFNSSFKSVKTNQNLWKWYLHPQFIQSFFPIKKCPKLTNFDVFSTFLVKKKKKKKKTWPGEKMDHFVILKCQHINHQYYDNISLSFSSTFYLRELST